MKIRILFLLFFPFMIMSCDPFSVAEISNHSQHEANIEICYDKESLNAYFPNYTFKEVSERLEFHPNHSGFIELDSVNYRIVLRLKPNQVVAIDGGRKSLPNFDIFRQITINSAAEYTGEDEISEAFKKNGAVLYELKIK